MKLELTRHIPVHEHTLAPLTWIQAPSPTPVSAPATAPPPTPAPWAWPPTPVSAPAAIPAITPDNAPKPESLQGYPESGIYIPGNMKASPKRRHFWCSPGKSPPELIRIAIVSFEILIELQNIIRRIYPNTIMPAYHSQFNELSQPTNVCNCALLPMKTKVRGPAPPAVASEPDIVDEILDYFRANVLFSSFEMQGSADRVLVYGTFFVQLCLRKLHSVSTKDQAMRTLHQLAVDNFSIPGEDGFPLGGMVSAPQNTNERDTIRGFLKQLREEIAQRLVERVFPSAEQKSKWWMAFSKRKFMNKELLR